MLPENDDFALELDSRLGCALVDAGKYSEAVPIFREIFKRNELEEKQRLQVFYGVALIRSWNSLVCNRHVRNHGPRGSTPKLSYRGGHE